MTRLTACEERRVIEYYYLLDSQLSCLNSPQKVDRQIAQETDSETEICFQVYWVVLLVILPAGRGQGKQDRVVRGCELGYSGLSWSHGILWS